MFSEVNHKEGTMRLFSSISKTLMRAAIPAADSKCPMLLFTDPRYVVFPGLSPKNIPRALTSVGSPILVPVPEIGKVNCK